MKNDKTVLIVEDEKTMQNNMKMAVESAGIKVITADNGEECVDKCLNENIDLILLDLNLPILSGMAAMKIIKSKNPNFKTPVIVFTNADDLTKMSEVIGDNVVEYLVKSDHSLDELVLKVKSKLGI